MNFEDESYVRLPTAVTEIPAEIVVLGLDRLLFDGSVTRELNGLRITDFDGKRADRATHNWSKVNYELIYDRDGAACRYCACSDPDELSIDHVVPRCQGGQDSPDNLVVACMACNRRKGGRTPEQAGMVLR